MYKRSKRASKQSKIRFKGHRANSELQVLGTNKDDIIIKAENLGITDFHIVEILKDRLGFENITLANDAKCAGLCEKVYGNLKPYNDAIFICLGTGIGGAVFLDGKLLESKKFSGFELRAYYN